MTTPVNSSQAPVGALCERLEWDSEFFGIGVGRALPSRLTEPAAAELLHWCAENSIDCLYFLAEADDARTLQLLEERGFRLVDIRMNLARAMSCAPPSPGGAALIRPARTGDVPALRGIAKTGHRDSRFYFDPEFPTSRCDDLYETWIEKSCNGYADAVFVADYDARPSGYISCHLRGDAGNIGLLGVDAAVRGIGLGRQLIHAALAWFADRGVARVTVTTQGRNVGAQRLYQNTGFRTDSIQLWYHLWFNRHQNRK